MLWFLQSEVKIWNYKSISHPWLAVPVHHPKFTCYISVYFQYTIPSGNWSHVSIALAGKLYFHIGIFLFLSSLTIFDWPRSTARSHYILVVISVNFCSYHHEFVVLTSLSCLLFSFFQQGNILLS